MKNKLIFIPLICCVFFFSACTNTNDSGNTIDNSGTDKELQDIKAFDREKDNFVFEENRSKYGTLNDDFVFDGWFMPLRDEEIADLYKVLKINSWEKQEEATWEPAGKEKITISQYTGNDQDEYIYLYEGDLACVKMIPRAYDETPIDTFYQMPAGDLERIHQYIQNFYDNKREQVLDTASFFPLFFSTDFRIDWVRYYSEAKSFQGQSMNQVFYMCHGSEDMAEDMLAALGDTEKWESVPPNDYLTQSQYDNKNNDVSLNNGEFNIYIYHPNDSSICIAVSGYAAFLTDDIELESRIMEIVEKYPDDWRIMLMEE